MRKKVSPRDFSIYIIILSIMLFILVDSTFKLYDISYDKSIFLLAIPFVFILIYLLYRVKYFYFSLVILFFIPRPFYMIKNLKGFCLNTAAFFQNLINNQYILEEYYKHFILLMLIGIPIMAAILFYSVVLKRHTFPTLVFGASIFSTYYFLGNDKIFNNLSIYLSLNLLLYAYNQYLIMRIKFGEDNANVKENYFKRFMSFSIILIVLTSFITKILPYDRKPITYAWVDKYIISKIENIKGRAERTLSDSAQRSGFSLKSTGYQPNPKKLGGPIQLNDNLALRIYTEEKNKELHLRGTIKDYYSGELWNKTDKTTQKFEAEIKIEDTRDAYSVKSMKINHVGTKTSTIFNVLYPHSVKNNYNYIFVDSDLEIYNPRVIKKGREYELEYKDYNISEENNLRLKYSRFVNYQDELKKYLQLPNINDRVYKLTEDITKSYSTPYEKASAIEKYLRDNYKYDMETTTLPKDREFVDYFLFDEKKGYCTYYASAMAIMCRIVNIPSRYVEGFTVDIGNSGSNEKDVLNSNAHAWVELYFDEAGWVAFDPTPGHESPSLKFNEDSNPGSNVDTPSNSNSNPNEKQNPSNNKNQEDKDKEVEPVKDKDKRPVSIGIYLLILLLIFLSSVFIYLYRNRLGNRKKFMGNAMRIITIYGIHIGVVIGKGETIREILTRLMTELNMDKDESVIKIFEEVLYGGKTLEEKDTLDLREFIIRVKKSEINRLGWFKFYLLDYISMFKL